ncbi:uncharacterized protein RAG0_16414 [Rhynchosporium agropyri]|uniref:Uncharacterized protein n=1 Tax=Rhynchosporium agropyri TaxID=914238 RepID=A0A1E1LQ99_9HELO|nr:uncharacterized protein RAG0_16414 [Rhynchosporium agropyri]
MSDHQTIHQELIQCQQTVFERGQASLLDITATRMCISPGLGDVSRSRRSIESCARAEGTTRSYCDLAPCWCYWPNSQRCALYRYIRKGEFVIFETIKAEVEIASDHSTYGAVTEGYIKLRSFVTEAYWKVDDHLTSSLAERPTFPPTPPDKSTGHGTRYCLRLHPEAVETNLFLDDAGRAPCPLLMLVPNLRTNFFTDFVPWKHPSS